MKVSVYIVLMFCLTGLWGIEKESSDSTGVSKIILFKYSQETAYSQPFIAQAQLDARNRIGNKEYMTGFVKGLSFPYFTTLGIQLNRDMGQFPQSIPGDTEPRVYFWAYYKETDSIRRYQQTIGSLMGSTVSAVIFYSIYLQIESNARRNNR